MRPNGLAIVAAERRVHLPSESEGRRAAEHAVGRTLAVEAVRRLTGTLRPVAVVAGPRGEPRFPLGVVGSIAHSGGLVAVRIGSVASGVLGVGIDVVERTAPTDRLDVVVGARSELAAAARAAGPLAAPLALLSAKESVFKAWYPLTGRWLEFDEVVVRLRRDGTFRVRLPEARPGERWSGTWEQRSGFLRTAVVVREARRRGRPRQPTS